MRRQRCRLYVSTATGKSTCEDLQVASVLEVGIYGQLVYTLPRASTGKRKRRHVGTPACEHHLRRWMEEQVVRTMKDGELALRMMRR